jgi:hypothetical protein
MRACNLFPRERLSETRRVNRPPPPSRAPGIAREPSATALRLARDARLEQWRDASKRVTRRWNGWLASGGADRPRAYSEYVIALASEEVAAWELERATALLHGTGTR